MNQDIPLSGQVGNGHNRWHPHIKPRIRIASGTQVEIETLDGFDGQIGPGMKCEEIPHLDMGRIHPLTGPVYVEGAVPGDLLAVHIDEVVPAKTGFTFVFPGFGFLRDVFGKPHVLHWEMANGFAQSEQLPGVRIPGAPFMGVMGLAPSLDLLKRINAREADLAARGGFVLLPDVNAAVPSGPEIASLAMRTIAPHETGGNVDIKQLVAGSTLYLPVDVEGGLFSVGDAHFAQGDGESCGSAVETSATLVARFEVLKGEAARRKQIYPTFSNRGGVHTAYPKGYYATTGTCIRQDGRNEAEDLTLAARNALLNMVDHIVDAHGYTREQAYCLCSVAVDLRISQAVDVPNVIVSAFLPQHIFES
ncbi:acetamidase/formamidase family protein [Bradyrhizobium ottawaense]|uniref:acetamidase/formamidase family protein n=1 Tax=Bradyrhizobium ottawaense TaxID=931866 RepID=UPI001AEBD35A|nr:acetamidase/formamidase family protein [Bradyrhizobium ottawaense]